MINIHVVLVISGDHLCMATNMDHPHYFDVAILIWSQHVQNDWFPW